MCHILFLLCPILCLSAKDSEFMETDQLVYGKLNSNENTLSLFDCDANDGSERCVHRKFLFWPCFQAQKGKVALIYAEQRSFVFLPGEQ
jgi:hypothetical protein